jgi:hypothetical protein
MGNHKKDLPSPYTRELDARDERFCQRIVSGMKPHMAYLDAGFSGETMEAVRKQLRRPEIHDRIRCIRAVQAIHLNVSLETIVMQLEEARLLAMQSLQLSAAVNAIVAKAKILGFLDDGIGRRDPALPKPASEPTVDKEMSLEAWQERFANAKVIDGKLN